MMDIAGALFFFTGLIAVVVFAGLGLVLAWGESQARYIAAPEFKPACCEVPDAVKKAA